MSLNDKQACEIALLDLPPEVLENVFVHIPALDLIRTMTMVCHKWRDIILRRRFQPWKKSYFRKKLKQNGLKCNYNEDDDDDDEPPAKKNKDEYDLRDDLDWKYQEIRDALNESVEKVWNENINDNQYLHPAKDNPDEKVEKFRLEIAAPWLINFISEEFKSQEKENLFQQIRMHSKYTLAEDVLKERMPKLQDSKIAIITVLCCIAADAWDVEEIIRVLTKPSLKSCPSLVASEVLYAIALAFLHFHRHYSLPSKYHYNVFHALSFFENEYVGGITEKVVKPNKGQASLVHMGITKTSDKVKLTAEQARIANHQLSKNRHDVIKIIAFAGTGKTTTLIQMCERHPKLKFLVVVYNTSVRDHATKVFPSNNVTISTAHSLAFKKVGWKYKEPRDEKGNCVKFSFNLKSQDIIDSGLLTTSVGPSNKLRLFACTYYQRAAQVLKCLENFMNSPDEEITLENVPSRWESVTDTQIKTVTLQSYVRNADLDDARKVWNSMINVNDLRVKMTHDGYLKLFQLTCPDLQENVEHDVLMIDEGQDMNPAMLDIFQRQRVTKIIVGDPNQQIYMFRGAINALASIESTQTFHLTQSFRFGPQIGLAANSCLEICQYVCKQTLVGGKKRDFIISREDINSETIEKYKPVAVIGRTNFRVFQEVVDLICNPDSPPSATYFYDKNFMDKILNMYYLYDKKRDKMTSLKNFASFGALKAFAKSTDDKEMMGKINIVEYFGSKIPEIIDKMKQRCNCDPKTADYIFTTTHKAKGLEWKTVILCSDFTENLKSLFSDELKAHMLIDSEDEKNILYVAMTRAKEYLAINYSIFDVLCTAGETFEVITSMKQKKLGQHHLKCLVCGENIIFEENVIGLESRKITLKRFVKTAPGPSTFGQMNDDHKQVEKKPGLFCSVCATSPKLFDNAIIGVTRTTAKMKSRIFTRFLCGVLPTKFQEGLNKLKANTNENEYFVAAVNLPVHLLFPEAFDDEDFENMVNEEFGNNNESHEISVEEEKLISDAMNEKFEEKETMTIEEQKAIADAMEEDFDVPGPSQRQVQVKKSSRKRILKKL